MATKESATTNDLVPRLIKSVHVTDESRSMAAMRLPSAVVPLVDAVDPGAPRRDGTVGGLDERRATRRGGGR